MKSLIEKIKENFFENIEDKIFKENFYFLACGPNLDEDEIYFTLLVPQKDSFDIYSISEYYKETKFEKVDRNIFIIEQSSLKEEILNFGKLKSIDDVMEQLNYHLDFQQLPQIKKFLIDSLELLRTIKNKDELDELNETQNKKTFKM